MNFLLRQLQRAGVMKHACIACGELSTAQKVAAHIQGRVVMHMGSDTRPGPYWIVHESDSQALQGKGYKLVELNRQG